MNGRRLLFSFRAFCFCKSFADGAKLLENALQSHSVNSILQLKVGAFGACGCLSGCSPLIVILFAWNDLIYRFAFTCFTYLVVSSYETIVRNAIFCFVVSSKWVRNTMHRYVFDGILR